MTKIRFSNHKPVIRDGKLIRLSADSTNNDCCCCNEYAIFFCNSNAQRDNAYYVSLNGQQIGTHDPQDEGTIDGEFWTTHPDITLDALSCENCEVCAQDDPWVQDSIALPPDYTVVIDNPAYVPGKDGFDLSNFALCQDCIGEGVTPIEGETTPPPAEIRVLALDKTLLNESGNNTLDIVNSESPPSPGSPGAYGRIWVINFKFNASENRFEVCSIILSTAYSDGDPSAAFSYEFMLGGNPLP